MDLPKKKPPTDPQIRRANITINNPDKYGVDAAYIIATCDKLNAAYYCFCREKGENGTEHHHIYLERNSAYRFSTLKHYFPAAHIERALGTAQQNRDYFQKCGKWEHTDKSGTTIQDTFYENMPLDQVPSAQGKHELSCALIRQGLSNAEIIEQHKMFAYDSNNLDTLRQTLLCTDYKSTTRKVEAIYLTGGSNKERTQFIYDTFGFSAVYRVTDYPKNGVKFDGYMNQDVLVFEPFGANAIDETLLINLLAGFPLQLPARYVPRQACFTKLIISSPVPLVSQLKLLSPVDTIEFVEIHGYFKTIINLDNLLEDTAP